MVIHKAVSILFAACLATLASSGTSGIASATPRPGAATVAKLVQPAGINPFNVTVLNAHVSGQRTVDLTRCSTAYCRLADKRAIQIADGRAGFAARSAATTIASSLAAADAVQSALSAAQAAATAKAAATGAAATATATATSAPVMHASVRPGLAYSAITKSRHQASARTHIAYTVTLTATETESASAPAPPPVVTPPPGPGTYAPCTTSASCDIPATFGDAGLVAEVNRYRAAAGLSAVTGYWGGNVNVVGPCAIQNTTLPGGDCSSGEISEADLGYMTDAGTELIDEVYADGPSEVHYQIMMAANVTRLYWCFGYNPSTKTYGLTSRFGS